MRRTLRNKIDWEMLALKLFGGTVLVMATLFVIGAAILMWRVAFNQLCPAP
jgi:hypothetical protein